MPSQKAEAFAVATIDTYQARTQHLTAETARSITVAQNGLEASERGQFSLGNATKLARSSIETYREKVAEGIPRHEAAQQAAKEMGQRFDDQGRDSQRQPQRQAQGQSQSI